MATLVLSTVGTFLGGPIGGAIGSLIGQSIDQQVFASPRRGPRLGDLAVQTSSYGTQIPRIYGTMRVAGSIIWSTDLVESSTTSGAKGQPDVVYSYSVSFAVALSSRPASAIKRIWADGKLLRGEAGDFKVSTEFRFYEGGEDQPADPLIASVEGISNTPAYRGLALAVFENLELAEFGNRIPFITFEVEADTVAPTISGILADASGQRIACSDSSELVGYAALGRSISTAVAPLIDVFGVQLIDDGAAVRSPAVTSSLQVVEDDLGASVSVEAASRIEREQTPARELPTDLTLSYYDPDRDYQSGATRARVGEQSTNEVQVELPVVINATAARSLAEDLIARRWAERDKVVIRLRPAFLALEPGSPLAIDDSPLIWQTRSCTVDGMAVVAELRPEWRISTLVAGDPGRSSSDPDVVTGPLTVALFEIPSITGAPSSAPVLQVAASSPGAGWKTVTIDVAGGGFSATIPSARRKAVLGATVNTLAPGQSYLLDLENSLEIQLIDEDQWLTSCDDESLVNGSNLALVGRELIQFGTADPLGPGRFRLSRLLRGRFGMDSSADQDPGATFVLIDPQALRATPIPDWLRGSIVTAARPGNPPDASTLVSGVSVCPPSPVNVRAEIGTELMLGWTRRDRLGWSWVDEVDAPLSERAERYSISIEGAGGSIERECASPELVIGGTELAALAAGPATIRIRQIGDWAASAPAVISIVLT